MTKQCLTGLDNSQTGLLLGNIDANALFEHLKLLLVACYVIANSSHWSINVGYIGA